MSEDGGQSLESFLKRHAPTAPPAPYREKQRIWRAIESQQSLGWKFNVFAALNLRWALPAAAALALVATFFFYKKRVNDWETDRILTAALGYHIEELNEQDSPF